MSKQIGVECHYLDGCVVQHNFIYMAAQLDDLDPDEYLHTRMTGFCELIIGRKGLRSDGKPSNGWAYHDLEMHIVSVCVKQETPVEGRRLCALSKEGEVEIFSGKSGKGVIEKIPDAGLRLSEYTEEGVTGYVTHIREIGDSLYVCGQSGQVYRRTESGWIHIDAGVFSPLRDPDDDEVNSFNCIDGNDGNDLYVVGDDGVVFHCDGFVWRPVQVNTREHLLWVRCYGRDEVYICGYNGTLLRGSARNGFKDVSALEDNFTWWCLCKFRDKVYLSATEGLYAWDGKKIARVGTGLSPEVETYRLDADREGKTLWSFGAKDLACFDGQKWQRLHDPDNPRIGE
ncbi:MAG: hypothetical protein LBI92_06230 [Azoarcus sp.]|jgi:hypothetical protein|nr:hypothetical protein [Azoarcus sp.]